MKIPSLSGSDSFQKQQNQVLNGLLPHEETNPAYKTEISSGQTAHNMLVTRIKSSKKLTDDDKREFLAMVDAYNKNSSSSSGSHKFITSVLMLIHMRETENDQKQRHGKPWPDKQRAAEQSAIQEQPNIQEPATTQEQSNPPSPE